MYKWLNCEWKGKAHVHPPPQCASPIWNGRGKHMVEGEAHCGGGSTWWMEILFGTKFEGFRGGLYRLIVARL